MQLGRHVAVREFKAKMLVAVANRSFTNKNTLSSRAAKKLVLLLLGPAQELDSDFDHV
jgi:hypothetical protein